MKAILVAFLLAALSGPKPAEDLPAYMAALDELVAHRRRVAELAAAWRSVEAEELMKAATPGGLGSDFEFTRIPVPDAIPRPRTSTPAAVDMARFLLWIGFPEVAVPLLDEWIRRGVEAPPELTSAVFRDLLRSGQLETARQWAEQHPSLQTARVQEALEHPEAYEGVASGAARARGALALWRTRPALPDAAFFDRLIAGLPLHGRVLALEAAAARPGVTVDEKVKVQRLRQAARESGKDRAYDAWRRLANAQLTPYATAEASYKWGSLELARGRPAAAIPLLEQARELDPDIIGGPAQWKLALAHFEAGDFAAALRAWERDETEFLGSPCCRRRDGARKHRTWQGLALERLGRVDEALAHYLAALGEPSVAAHLLDLYEAAGQFEDVERLFPEATPRTPHGYADTVPGLSMLVLRKMARAGDWASLVAAAASAGDPDHPSDDGVQPSRLGPRAIAREARRLLARNCDATVPVIVASLAAVPRHQGAAQVRALGHCGTPPAVQVLLAFAVDESPHVAQVARAALAATPLGREALAARGWSVPPVPAADPQPEPPLLFPPADGRPLPSRVTPVVRRITRHDWERRNRLLSRRMCECPD